MSDHVLLCRFGSCLAVAGLLEKSNLNRSCVCVWGGVGEDVLFWVRLGIPFGDQLGVHLGTTSDLILDR